MRIVIDTELCSGHGRCVDLLPAVFELDESGFGRVRDDAVTPTRADIDKVAALCPELAIAVED